jgi:Bacterial mobilisation protein (MobC)
MARYGRGYAGEYRTRSIGIKLTPAERRELESAAKARGAPLSEYVRDLCLRRSAAASARTGRNPEAKALADQLSRIGNNLNQLARIANTKGATPHLYELRMVTGMVKAALRQVLDLRRDP